MNFWQVRFHHKLIILTWLTLTTLTILWVKHYLFLFNLRLHFPPHHPPPRWIIGLLLQNTYLSVMESWLRLPSTTTSWSRCRRPPPWGTTYLLTIPFCCPWLLPWGLFLVHSLWPIFSAITNDLPDDALTKLFPSLHDEQNSQIHPIIPLPNFPPNSSATDISASFTNISSFLPEDLSLKINNPTLLFSSSHFPSLPLPALFSLLDS